MFITLNPKKNAVVSVPTTAEQIWLKSSRLWYEFGRWLSRISTGSPYYPDLSFRFCTQAIQAEKVANLNLGHHRFFHVLYNQLWQYITAHALCMLDYKCYRRTPRIYNTYCFSTATIVTRTRRNATLYAHCLSCVFMMYYLLLIIT